MPPCCTGLYLTTYQTATKQAPVIVSSDFGNVKRSRRSTVDKGVLYYGGHYVGVVLYRAHSALSRTHAVHALNAPGRFKTLERLCRYTRFRSKSLVLMARVRDFTLRNVVDN